MQQIQIGAYTVEGEIARGGAGVVYRARHTARGTPVAIKVMLEPHRDPDEVERFRREAEATFRLRHPHVVGVLEFDYHQGYPYLVLELVEGMSLQDRLEREGTIVVEDLIRIGEQIADALHYAHSMGLVHRDLKPHNILLEAATGRAVLTDFGIAQFSGDASKETLTVTGEVMGTPAYMSPEQALGDRERVGPMSDVYALAATLYAGMCGRPPFDDEMAMVVMQQVVTDPPPHPLTFNPQANPALSKLVLQCMAKVPSERGHTAETLREALRDLLARTTGTGGTRYQPQSKAPLVISFAVAAVVWGLVGLMLGRATAPESAARVEPTPAQPTTPDVPASRSDGWWSAPPGSLDPETASSGPEQLELGLRALLADRPRMARQALSDHLITDGESPGVLWALALAQERLGDWEGLLDTSERLARSAPEDRWAPTFRARALLGLGQVDEALRQLEGASSVEGRVLRARALERRDPAAARRELEEVDPGHPAFDSWPAASGVFEQGDPRREELLRGRLERHPRDLLAVLDLAWLLGSRASGDELPELLAAAEAREPEHPRLRELALTVPLMHGGRLKLPPQAEAEATLIGLRDVARRDSGRWRAQIYRGWLASEFRLTDEHAQATGSGLGLVRQEIGLAYHLIASVRLDQGKPTEAVRYLDMASDMIPQLIAAKVLAYQAQAGRADYLAAGRLARWLNANAGDRFDRSFPAATFLTHGLLARSYAELTQAKRNDPITKATQAALAFRTGKLDWAAPALAELHQQQPNAFTEYTLAHATEKNVDRLQQLRLNALNALERRVLEGLPGLAVMRVAELLRVTPYDATLRLARVRALLLDGNHDQALRDLADATGWAFRREKVEGATTTNDALVLLAESGLTLGHPTLTIALANEIERRGTRGKSQTCLERAVAYADLGLFALGLAECEKGLKHAQDDTARALLINTQGILYERLDRFEDARRAFTTMSMPGAPGGHLWASRPLMSEALLSIARAEFESGSRERASAAYDEALEVAKLERKSAMAYSPLLGERITDAYALHGRTLAGMTGVVRCRIAEGNRAEAKRALEHAEKLVLHGHQPRLRDARLLNEAAELLR